MKRPRQFSFSRPRGGMSITMMLVMLALLAMLGLIEIGYLFWAKRDAQKVADLAALAGAQRLELCTSDNSDNSAARQSALTQNTFAGSLEIRCGNWNVTRATEGHFSPVVDAANQRNAVRVITRRAVLPFFGQNSSLPTVTAQAVARRAEPTAVFSVGSQLLRINGNTPLGNVLKLVGADLDKTTLLGYDGLAQAHITPNGLLQALGIPIDVNMGVAEFNNLLAGRKVKLGKILQATVDLLTQQGVAHVDLSALENALVVKGIDLKQLEVKLGSDDSGGGLFARVVAPDGTISSALQADVNVLDLIGTSISIANGGRAVSVDELNLLGLVNAKAAVVEPPSIAIGGVGSRAYNAQIRVFLDIDTNNIPVAGGVLSLLGIRLKLPVHADVTNAMATLTSLQCGSTPPTATIKVESSVLRACVGKVADSERFSKQNVCGDTLQKEQMLTLLGAPLINDSIKVNTLTDTQSLTLPAGATGSTQVNSLEVGTAVSELVSELLRVLSGMLDPRDDGMSQGSTAAQLADRYLKAANVGRKRYDVDATIKLLEFGDSTQGLKPLGNWDITKGVPTSCVLVTCMVDGKVWQGFRNAVTGVGSGLLDGVLGALVGGLLVKQCNSLIGALDDTTYNNCMKYNLTSYLQTADAGFLDQFAGDGVTAPGNGPVSCSGLLCLLLKPALDVLKPLLNSVGSLLRSLLAQVLGLELGRTDVHVQSIQCTPAQLVY
ncbi:TPA: TadG family pilus assembly protein [Stenotrophomonas maltophilia]|jgi:uncharacterized membrane protein|uniref:TadG family pilus assembly protein n=1 Tax=Stenotrophomonas TaxID=40323 RepID=UPI000E992310|nr:MULTISPECIES: TadG family pilus assembly protein [Stenotrophomonas]HBP04570.1 hypothetical protein [Stenotrophomonas sp.]EKU9958843.1 hypothetical protein [Stenotrophomonas maltophilia]EKU9986563.1 hypothetical protein [Stenotrophomonas maltophilia]QDY48959.1 hypothetical protein DUW70_10730 [Stenotrophomonas maltophilia]HEL4832238.1 hypothetical protein [Stenotrophomonas maltophilia]